MLRKRGFLGLLGDLIDAARGPLDDVRVAFPAIQPYSAVDQVQWLTVAVKIVLAFVQIRFEFHTGSIFPRGQVFAATENMDLIR
jgi:hypothetical protein